MDVDADPDADPEFEGAFFDIGGVLLDLSTVRDGYEAFLRRYAEREGIDNVEALIDDWKRALGHYFRSREGTEYRTARAGYARAIDLAVAAREGADLDALLAGEAEVERSIPESEWFPLFEAASDEHLEPTDGAVETVRALDEAGFYLGIISDIDHWEAERMLDRFGLREFFDDVTTSEEVGRTKPDPEMFEVALSAASVDPGASVYVGDRYDHDMRGGSAAGLVTVAHGGTAAEQAEADPDRAVDYAVDDLRDLLDVVGVDRDGDRA